MKNHKKVTVVIAIIMLIGFFILAAFMHSSGEIEALASQFYSFEIKAKEITSQSKDSYIMENFPGVDKIFTLQDQKKNPISTLFLVSSGGYGGFVNLAVAVDNNTNKTIGVKVLNHKETPSYGGPITENWFLERLIQKSTENYLKLIKLDPERESHVVQITGATISSQAVVNGVNAAIGAFNYLQLGIKMAAVPLDVSQAAASEEMETFYINGGSKGSIKVTMSELRKLPTVKRQTILKKSTGTEIFMTVEGPTLDFVLSYFGENLIDFKGLGVTARDGYYALIPEEILKNREIILAYTFNDEEILEEEKPIRLVIPDEFGVYWVKLVETIDLYKEVSEKQIGSMKMFDAITRDIEPYMYQYYGSKDKAIEIGKILAKLEDVDTKGFFTMVSSDGLMKNETMTMVKQRYYIKIEGENAPMNIGPDFKLGMNVKELAYFSTTKDAIIFPQEMIKLTEQVQLEGYWGMPLIEAMEEVGFKDVAQKHFELISESGEKITATGDKLRQCILQYDDKSVTAIFKTDKGIEKLEYLLEINAL
jgi:Na+-translocating ferredoxin:NAD+ oxidoreductase RnfG subunit